LALEGFGATEKEVVGRTASQFSIGPARHPVGDSGKSSTRIIRSTSLLSDGMPMRRTKEVDFARMKLRNDAFHISDNAFDR